LIGTKGNLLKFAVWSKEFIEMTQAKRRSMIVHPHASSEKENSRQRENEGIKAKQIPIAMVTFPSEPQQFQESKAEMKPNVSLVKNEPHFVSSLCSDIKPSNIVDLTQDDFDLDSTMETQSSPVPIYDTSTGSMENHHRLVVGNATDNTIDSTTDSTIDQKMIWTKFEFSMQDSIISSFMEEYNRLNTWIEDSKTMLLQASKQIKDFIAQGKVAQALEFGMKIEQIKKEMSKNKTQRDMILVHLILYTCHQINQQETMAKQLKKWKGLDLQYVQEASHRKCFHLEKEIQFKQKEIVKKRLQMEETIVMKKFSFEEMVFLNQLVQEEEKHIQQMEQQRTKEILKVFEFSQFIRSLVQKQLS
jgi:hypothetical protein